MDKKRKAVIAGFIIFLLVLGVCSLVTKGIYTAGLPRVTTATAREMALYHPVTAMGVVETRQEYGVYAPSGLRVAAIACQKGDHFAAGDALIQMDVEDLQRILDGKDLERQRQALQQREAESRSVQNRQETAKTLARAQEDYETMRLTGELQVSRTTGELIRAQSALDNLRKELDQANKNLDQARKNMEQAKRDQAAADPSGQTGNGEGSVSGGDHTDARPDLSALSQQCAEAETAVRQLQAQISQQEQTVIAAAQAAQDAQLAHADGLKEAQRSVDDARAAATGGYQAAADLAGMEQAYLEGEIRELQELLDAEGWLYAREGGRVTQLCVNVGQRTPDTAQLLYTPDDGLRLLRARLSEEQVQYVTVGTRMQLGFETVSRGKQSKEGIVSYMEAQADGAAEICLDVTDMGMELGQQVLLKSTWQSENYSLVVPVSALRQDANGNAFLYILQQQNGILGLEWHAAALYVDVQDKNSRYAAVESASLSEETQIILTSSADLKDNAVVRIVE